MAQQLDQQVLDIRYRAVSSPPMVAPVRQRGRYQKLAQGAHAAVVRKRTIGADCLADPAIRAEGEMGQFAQATTRPWSQIPRQMHSLSCSIRI